MTIMRKRIKFLFIGFTVIALFYLNFVDVKFILRGEYSSPLLESKCHKPSSPYELTITTLTKHSASYIKEWIEYHLLIGVDHFFILDNESTDDVYSVLLPYIEEQLITYVPWRDSSHRDIQFETVVNTQQKGLAYVLSLYGCKSLWTALIDDDEFLLPKSNRTMKDVLKDYTDHGGLAIGWAWFGSNGHISKPNGLVIESFTKRRMELDRLHKAVIQPQYFKRMKTVHFPIFIQSYSLVTEKFDVIPSHTLNYDTCDIIQLNHYKVKSKDDWTERIQRGAVAGPPWIDKLADFYAFNYNDVEDTDILKFLPALKKRMGLET